MAVLTTISGLIPVTALDYEYGNLDLEAEHTLSYMSDKDRVVRANVYINGVNDKFVRALRIGKQIRVTVEVLDEHNDTGES